jgi:hypothetical protein
MIAEESLLVQLLQLIDTVPVSGPRTHRRGRPRTYSDRLFLKATLVMTVRHLTRVHELLAVLREPTPEMARVRALFAERGRFPSRRTFERRLAALAEDLPAVIGAFGRELVELLEPWAHSGRAVALDSTALRAYGGVWHKRHREAGVLPHTAIDTEAGWTRSGWHGWVYGWKLHLATAVGPVWIPLAAELTPANVADSEIAPRLAAELPGEARFVLGDLHYDAPGVRQLCRAAERILVTPKRGPRPHRDRGARVRGILHRLRSVASENFNEHFKSIFGVHAQVPTKGLLATRRFALGAVFTYQLALLYRYLHGLTLNVGLKPFLKAA